MLSSFCVTAFALFLPYMSYEKKIDRQIICIRTSELLMSNHLCFNEMPQSNTLLGAVQVVSMLCMLVFQKYKNRHKASSLEPVVQQEHFLLLTFLL